MNEQVNHEVVATLELIASMRGSMAEATVESLRQRFPGAAAPVVDFVGGLAAVIGLSERESRGEEVPDEEIKALVDAVYAAAEGLAEVPDLDRLRIIADLLELVEGYDLAWFGSSLVAQVPEIDPEAMGAESHAEVAEMVAVVARFQIGQFLEESELDDDVLDLLEVAEAIARIRPEDEGLRELLAEGIRHYATLECWQVMTPIREDDCEDLKLDDAVCDAVEELAGMLEAPQFVYLSLLLLAEDLELSGAISGSRPPRQVALLAFAVLHQVDNEEAFVDDEVLAWAKIAADSLQGLTVAAMAALLEWTPDDDDPYLRQCRRWRIATMDPGYVPSRFVDFEAEAEAYSLEAARAAMADFEREAWLMIHPGEVLRYFLDRFELAEDDLLDEELLADALTSWKASSPVVRDMLAQDPGLEEQLSLL